MWEVFVFEEFELDYSKSRPKFYCNLANLL